MKVADGLAFVFFTLGGETGLINENEGDIQRTSQTCGRGGIGRRAALRSLWERSRGSSSLLDRTILELSLCSANEFLISYVWRRGETMPEDDIVQGALKHYRLSPSGNSSLAAIKPPSKLCRLNSPSYGRLVIC